MTRSIGGVTVIAEPVELCHMKNPWNNQLCPNPADIIWKDRSMCAECANRMGILYDYRADPH